jgi:hypothetical protein
MNAQHERAVTTDMLTSHDPTVRTGRDACS